MSKKEIENQEYTQINVRNVPAIIAAKIKVIALTHGETQNNVYVHALAKFIELYEKKNGPVKPGAKKKSINL